MHVLGPSAKNSPSDCPVQCPCANGAVGVPGRDAAGKTAYQSCKTTLSRESFM